MVILLFFLLHLQSTDGAEYPENWQLTFHRAADKYMDMDTSACPEMRKKKLREAMGLN
jgi:hypothetical protein